ncbi:two component transcriptional regulator, LuxR family [Methylorubrum salsuginis]|uniref:Two component transcriptional regulator, LuxR family n=1 Tax=Methylorubrum salsuginis TaxID=414703 RepID=A0A1I4BF82_9HYPH|nr:two component transcriptional regulator, LuxR family [Methylorubrum salsuginis]
MRRWRNSPPTKPGDARTVTTSLIDRPVSGISGGAVPTRDRPDTLLVVDDHPVVLGGVRSLAGQAGFRIIHEATDIVSGFRAFHRHRPRLVVTDLSFRDSGLSGLSLIRRLKALEPEVRILAFSMHADPIVVARALEGGALGFVLKDAGSDAFLEALAAVRAGRVSLPHALATEVAMLNRTVRPAPLATLSVRELQILSLMSQGKSYEAIADTLSVSYRTIVNASALMRSKLGVNSRAGLIQIAVEQRASGAFAD